jgi:Flp pilus assembly protein TadG
MLLNSRKRNSGVAMIEFVAVAPLILLLIFSVSEVGRALIRYNALTKGLHEGARYAASFALLGTTGTVNIDAQLTTRVKNVVVFGNPQGQGSPQLDGLTIGQITLTAVNATEISVDAVYPYQPMIGPTLRTFGLGSAPTTSFNMQAGITMRAL